MRQQQFSLFRRLLLGVVLGSLLHCAAPPAPAQWLVFDNANFALKVREIAEDAIRWVETINHYLTMYEKAVQQVTTLGGILTKVEDQILRHKNLVQTYRDIGFTVRAIFALKRQVENMVRSHLAIVNNLYHSIRNGVFDWESVKRDLEVFLKDTIGRRADDQIANLERLAALDNSFERMRYELWQAQARLARMQQLLKDYEDLLAAEIAKPFGEQQGVDTLKHQILATQQIIEQLHKQISELTAQVEERAKQYGVKIENHEQFGQQVAETQEAFSHVIEAKEELLHNLDRGF